ncbi:hypothetical protein SCHPADRAFT_91697 [Schizopora paradoxa]|uniref:Uncharacterized protein n=1 Tax=Schizopora paradoxa TaxID=27342 RepID=A0A0H2S4M9_9AGAM|nr:hypothetical protein SCHPADRAFT_91697 [Schizopora paradoxa]
MQPASDLLSKFQTEIQAAASARLASSNRGASGALEADLPNLYKSWPVFRSCSPSSPTSSSSYHYHLLERSLTLTPLPLPLPTDGRRPLIGGRAVFSPRVHLNGAPNHLRERSESFFSRAKAVRPRTLRRSLPPVSEPGCQRQSRRVLGFWKIFLSLGTRLLAVAA